jgi:hypothetical protein
MKIIYRISDAGYNKVKPDYINNEACLKNATEVFKDVDWLVIADNVSKETDDMIQKYVRKSDILYVSVGHGAGTFNLALDEAIKLDDDEIVYFIENDYLHTPDAQGSYISTVSFLSSKIFLRRIEGLPTVRLVSFLKHLPRIIMSIPDLYC